ncbi:MAG: ATP-binding protein [Kiloniellales bacterium]
MTNRRSGTGSSPGVLQASKDLPATRIAKPREGGSLRRFVRRFLRLRTILWVAFTIITLIPVTSLAIWMDRSAYTKEREAALEKHLLLARHIAADLSRYAIDVRSAFNMVRQQRDAALLPNGLTPHLSSLGIRCVFWMTMPARELDRRICADPDFEPGQLDKAIAFANPDGVSFSEVLPDASGKPTIYVIAHESPSLVAVAALSTDYFLKVQRAIAFGLQGHAAIVDRLGTAPAHPSATLTTQMASLATIEPIRRMMDGESGTAEFHSPVKQADMIAGFTTVRPGSWGVMVVQPVDEIVERAASERMAALVIVLGGILAAGLASWAFSGYLMRSISPVVEAAKANAAGYVGTETGSLQRGAPIDLRELAKSFNILARGMRSAYQHQADALEATRRAEADYRGIFENTVEGIYRSTPDGHLLRANPALVKLCGYRSEEELIAAMQDIGTEWYVDPKRRSVFLRQMEERDGVTNFVSEVYRLRTGERLWVMENARAVRDRAGKLLYFEGTVLDITERKRAEEASLRAIEAEAANRTKSEFLAALSHELRTPLNAIIGFSEMMKRATFGPLGSSRYAEYSKDIHDSGIHLLNLINDLLDLSKIEGKKYQLGDDTIVVPAFIPDVVRLIIPDASRERISIELDIYDELPALRADSRAVKQMMLNLLSNAVKFTPQGGRVVVSARCDDESLRLMVQDNGIGIEPQDIDKVLTPFGQIEGRGKESMKGTGLGLTIVKSLIELHGGRIEIDSAPGHGTTVSLVFPKSRVLPLALQPVVAKRELPRVSA